MSAFPARYPGRCAGCEERIHEGDLITSITDVWGGVVHDTCPDTPPERPATVCHDCHLVTPCWCDR